MYMSLLKLLFWIWLYSSTLQLEGLWLLWQKGCLVWCSSRTCPPSVDCNNPARDDDEVNQRPMSKSKSWSQVVSGWNAFQDGCVYNEENEVYTKMPPEKRSREYMYQLLEKIRFPLIEIEGIAERRAVMVDFRCSSRKSAVALAEALSTWHEVSFAKVRDREYIDVKFN